MSLIYDPWSGTYIDVPDNSYTPPDPYGVQVHNPNVYVQPPGVPAPPVPYESDTNSYFLGGDPGPHAPWIPPDASFGTDPSGVINQQNPTADPSQPFVNAGDTGGYLHGIGVTAGAGQSDTVAGQQAAYNAAIAAGVPEGWAQDWLARNPGDHTRLLEAWNSGTGGGGTGGGGSSGGRVGGGTQGNQGAFAPPPNALGWMPTLNLPTWQPPAPFEAPPAFAYGEMPAYPEYQKPADYVPGTFDYAEYQKPADYVPGTFSAPTIAEARQEPGFQFALDEGRRQMEASAAAKGIGRTGGTVKRLIGYGQEMADTNYGNVFNRNLGTFNTNEGNRAQAYGTNLAAGLGAYTTNRGNAFDNFAMNEGNRAGAYTTNAALGFGAWDANRANAANTWATNYGLAKDTYDYGYKALADEYGSRYTTSADKFAADTAEATGEYAPRRDEAVLTRQQAFAEWLAKMGIAENIFNEGSD